MYDAAFYETIRAGSIASATVLDVGCGEGWWGHTFAAHAGCDVLGIDGRYVVGSPLEGRFIALDLARESFAGLARVDLAVALEVAEHLPPDRADGFIADLAAVAPLVLFSAAIPGQGGTGHVNEQWPGYWVEKFNANGMAVSGALRWQIWGDQRVENWYRQNLLVASRTPEDHPDLFDTPLAPPWPVVHPVLYDARRG
jgi:SAM-dependent methyltransferase